VWRPLPGLIEDRWRARFGANDISQLTASLRSVASQLRPGLPRYLPVGGIASLDLDLDLDPELDPGRHPDPELDPGRHPDQRRPASAPAGHDVLDLDLSALLSRLLIAFTIEFERESRLPLAISASALRTVTEDGVPVGDLPRLTGVSRETVSTSLRLLGSRGYVTVAPDSGASRARLARLTPRGQQAQDHDRQLIAAIEDRWRQRFGPARLASLRASLERLYDRPEGGRPRLSEGLIPPPDGWRAHPPYLALTRAMIEDPSRALAQYPAVSHRGGFPDGS
jgi:DNA-binding MarR family transcriptional regulator